MNLRKYSWVLMLVAGGVLLYMVWAQSQPKPPQQIAPTATQPAATQATTAAATAAATTGAATEPASAPAASSAAAAAWVTDAHAPAVEAQRVVLGDTDPASGWRFQVDLAPEGAAIRRIALADYFTTVADKQLYSKLKDDAAYKAQAAEDPAKYQGHYRVVNPVVGEQEVYLPYQTRAIWIQTPQSPQRIKINLGDKGWRLASPPETAPADPNQQSVSFALIIGRGDGDNQQPVVRLTKTYTIRKGEYSIGMALRAENLLTEGSIQIGLEQYAATGMEREGFGQDHRRVVYGLLTDSGNVKAEAVVEEKLPELKLLNRYTLNPDLLVWMGETSKFFASLVYLQPADPQLIRQNPYRLAYYYAAIPDRQAGRSFLTGMYIGIDPSTAAAPAIELAAGQKSVPLNFSIFAGPKERDLFVDSPQYARLNYVSTIDFGGGCGACSSDWLALGVIWLLKKFSYVTFGNYGVAIILLVVLVRVVLHPLTKKGQVSMMRMQKLAPKMAQLKEKYKDDKDTLQREMMKVYKEQGMAAPLMGCLPMVLQLPIWIALWSGLNAAVELRHAAFLPVWITNLAAPDALGGIWSFSFEIPLIGSLMKPIHSFNLLPLLLTVAMYLQTKLMPSTAGPATPEQAAQQKMMRVLMPAMMLVFFYNAPSGLTLYIMASTFSSVIEQMIIRRHFKQQEAAAAAAETTVNVGKAPRAARPKKPKGPFWFKQG
jgi:YidC/Oxa1 family membrane protein insertase